VEVSHNIKLWWQASRLNYVKGKGGNGCAAFHREKFVPYGPPSGGNGGRGGDIYILPTPHLTSLASIPKKIRGNPGGNGQGSWQNGKAGEPTVIRVPLGTVVRELPRDDPRRVKDEWESEEESLEGLSAQERMEKMRQNRWIHYPGYAEDNADRDSFKVVEKRLYQLERDRRIERRRKAMNPLSLDLDKLEEVERAPDAPLGIRQTQHLGHLVAAGGAGGLGNPHFITQEDRSPKYATRGEEGERTTLFLELKLLADVGLVGMPNAGKSTLLRALTGGRAKSEVAAYAFTTLNPVVGVVRVGEDGSFEGGIHQGQIYDETRLEDQREYDRVVNGTEEISPPKTRHGYEFDLVESFRFTIADNPGLVEHASENVGLGHSFLRSIERSLALVYVVDLSGPEPWEELRVLRDELEAYQPGMSTRARMVIANKADLLAGEGSPEAVEEAKGKFKKLEEYVKNEIGALDVVPTSAKFSQNLTKVVGLMKNYVQDARSLPYSAPQGSLPP
jgi:GTP-binding protein